MYLSELVGGLRRRWWVVMIALLGTAALTYTAFTLVPSEQDARASLMILPTAKVANKAGNPYLALGGLEPAADMLAAAMNTGPVHESLAPLNGTATFEVSRDTTSSGPMLLVQVTADDPRKAISLLDSVITTMPEVLSELQARVSVRSTSNLLTLTEVTRDVKPEASITKQLRATLAAAVGGLALTVFGTNALDGLLLRRVVSKRKSQERSADVTSSGVESPPTWTWEVPERASAGSRHSPT